MLCSG